MTENLGNSRKFDEDKFIKSLTKVGDGHKNSEGELDPKYIKQELDNKLHMLNQRLFLRKLDGKDIESLVKKGAEKIFERFGDQKDEVLKTPNLDSDLVAEFNKLSLENED